MTEEFMYLPADEVIKLNLLALRLMPVKKADAHKVLSSEKLMAALRQCREKEGGLYAKSAVLMRALASAHAFASANRRTALLATKEFVIRNKGKFSIPDDPTAAIILREIREGRYSDEQISRWISHGTIEKR